MSIKNVSNRISNQNVGKLRAKKKSGTASNVPQDSLSGSVGKTDSGTDINQIRRKEHQTRRQANLEYADAKVAANAAGSGSFMGTIGAMSLKYPDGRWNLKELAAKALRQNNLATDYPEDVQAQVADIVAKTRPSPGVYVMPEDAKKPWVRDYRDKPFVSIDNGTLWTEMDPEKLAADPEANVSSKDIDQLQTAKRLPNGDIRISVAVSDIDAFIKKDSPLDKFMDVNTSSVYTPDKVFNLIPPELAEDICSLNPREERLATVYEYTVTPEGKIKDKDAFQAIVKSRTKLDYDSVSAWMEGEAEASPAMKAQGEGLLEDLTLQRQASDWIDKGNTKDLEIDRSESRILTENGNAVDVAFYNKGPANKIVENFMVTSNMVNSEFLQEKGYMTLERALTKPDKGTWRKMQKLASPHGFDLGREPDAGAITDFMAMYKKKDPEGYGDMAVQFFKLGGRGEYKAIRPGDELPGQFFLGVKNYMQSTASIRRGGDRVTPRQLKAALAGEPSPYTYDELNKFAQNLNEKGRNLAKAERMAEKMAVATMLEDRVGEHFKASVTYVKNGRAFCRIGDPPVEGKLSKAGNVEVGDKIDVKLDQINVEKGWIDFRPTR